MSLLSKIGRIRVSVGVRIFWYWLTPKNYYSGYWILIVQEIVIVKSTDFHGDKVEYPIQTGACYIK